MQFSTVAETEKSFFNTIVKQETNSTDIEKASIAEKYTNPNMLHYDFTEQKIRLFDNVLMGKYANLIKENCEVMKFDSQCRYKYKNNPEMLSRDHYGSPCLWYLILFVNGCEDASEFKDFDYVLLPKLSVIQKCLTTMEFIDKKDVY